MADQTPPSDSLATYSKSNTSEESIINRKIERRGLPSSFSSNLVNPRASPSRNKDGKGASSGKSVKSIVSFFESSQSNSWCAAYGDEKSVKSNKFKSTSASQVSSSNATSASQLPPVQKQHLVHAPDVEDYSLTLLKYRQYFTEKPLARCLDDQDQKTDVDGDQASAGNLKKDDIKRLSVEEEQLDVPKQRQPLARNDAAKKNLVGKRADLKAEAAPDSQPLLRRDPQVAAAYWNHVRNYLWISDKELEDGKHRGCEDSSTPEYFFFDPVPASPIASVPSPDFPGSRSVNNRRANSDASQRSQRSLEKQKHHLAVTQKQLDKLDDYIHKMHVDQEVLTASPTSTAPSPFASPTPQTHGAAARGGSSDYPEAQRCECCSKLRKNQAPNICRGSGHSQCRPPQRPAMKLSRGNSGQIHVPPILGEEDHDRNFF